MVKFRFWLSFYLMNLGVKVCPDKECQHWLGYGMAVAGEGIERSISEE